MTDAIPIRQLDWTLPLRVAAEWNNGQGSQVCAIIDSHPDRPLLVIPRIQRCYADQIVCCVNNAITGQAS